MEVVGEGGPGGGGGQPVEIAAFNARLNGLDHVDCREGDLFEPVEGETFDLIVSNPPFIVSPDNIFYFLHSGRTGDEVCRTIAHEAPRFLSDGGYCLAPRSGAQTTRLTVMVTLYLASLLS